MLSNTIPSIIALIGLFVLPESPKFLLSKGMHKECVEVLRHIYVINTGNLKTTYPCDIITLNVVGTSLGIVKGFKATAKFVFHQITAPFTQGRALQTINMCFITFMLNLIAQGILMYFPKIINNLISNPDQSLTVCGAVELVGQQSSNQTLEELCSSTNSQQYLFVACIGCCFMFFYVLISNVIRFTGKIPLLSKYF